MLSNNMSNLVSSQSENEKVTASVNMDKKQHLRTMTEKTEEKRLLRTSEDRTCTKTLVNIHMLPTKLTFFFAYALLGSYMPYLIVFLTSVGLSASQAGFIAGLRTVNAFIVGPLWGALADHTGRRKLIYVLLAGGTILFLFPLPWLAELVARDLITKSEQNNSNVDGNLTDDSIKYKTDTELDNLRIQLFSAMLTALLAAAVFDAPLMGYYDSIAMNVVSTDRKATFGYQRMFGSIGFGIANFLAGLAADHYNHPYLSSYTAIFFVLLPAGIIMLPLGLITIKQGNWNHELSGKKSGAKILKPVLKTITKPSNLLFFITIFVMGIGNALNFGFTFLLMEDYMDASKSIMGLTIVVSCIAEVLTFPIASNLIRLFGGNLHCIIIGLFAYFVRFLMLSYVENPWLVLPIQSMQCVSFALFWAAAIEQIQKISPKDINTTMFAILNGTHFGLSNLIANMLGGVLYQKYGGRRFFRFSSFLFLFWSIFMVCYFCMIQHFNMTIKKEEINIPEEEDCEEERSSG